MSVFRSNKEIYAQIINDITGTTLVAASSTDKDVQAKGNKTEVASLVGKAIAEKAVKAGMQTSRLTEMVTYIMVEWKP